ncbi:MAG TPA: hypothetical protein VF914_16520 [Chloroflexia bacterium]|jgi:hypothetical protein
MLSHLLRQVTGAIITFFLAVFVLYTAIMYNPGSPPNLLRRPPHDTGSAYIRSLRDAFELDKPWPVSFLAYMFDPGETTDVVAAGAGRDETYTKGVRVSALSIEISGAGLITGDLGRSINMAKGMPVADMLGPGLYLALASVCSLILTFGYVATVQRGGRPAPYARHLPPRTVASVSRFYLDPAGGALQGRRF